MTGEPRTTVLRQPRLPLLFWSVPIVALLAGSVWLLRLPSSATDHDQAWTAWFGIVVFGAMTLLAVVRLILTPRLVLTPEGVWRHGSLGQGRLYRWADIRRFYLWRAPDRIGLFGVRRSPQYVAFAWEPGREPQGVGAALAQGIDLPSGFFGDWGLKPQALLNLLSERHRIAAPGRYDDAGQPKPLLGVDLTRPPAR